MDIYYLRDEITPGSLWRYKGSTWGPAWEVIDLASADSNSDIYVIYRNSLQHGIKVTTPEAWLKTMYPIVEE